MWGSDPAIWNSSAPILFPIVGGLKDDSYLWNGVKYELKKHGFIRDNPDLLLTGITADSLTFGLASNKDTYKIYPFDFEFTIQFILEDAKIRVLHQVSNTGKSPLFLLWAVTRDSNARDMKMKSTRITTSNLRPMKIHPHGYCSMTGRFLTRQLLFSTTRIFFR